MSLTRTKWSEAELRAIVDALPTHAWVCRADGYSIYRNQQWLDYAGLNQDTARGWAYRDTIHADDLDNFLDQWKQLSDVGTAIEIEARFRRVDGEYRWFLVRALPVRDESGPIVNWFGTNTDIDDRKKSEALLAGENKILGMVATGKPLTAILEEVCSFFDSISTCSMASVLLVDTDDRLRKGAGPNLPNELLSSFEGMKIGPSVGSCGTAAYRKQQVIVTDIEGDPLWQDFRELARRHGLRAGWSTPIFSSEHRLLGVFGIHWLKSHSPTSAHLRLIDLMTHLASVAIERQHSQEALRASERVARGQAETLTRTLDQLSRESSFERIAEFALRTLTGKFDAVGSGVFLWNQTTGLMEVGYVLERGLFKSTADAELAAFFPSMSWHEIPQSRQAFETGRPVVMNDIRQELDFPRRDHLIRQGVITMLAVPSFVAGKPAAAFVIRFDQRRQFRPEELDLAQALGNQAMLAMQLTRLSEESRRMAVGGERNRMAREVHDTLAQGFTGVIVQLEAAAEAMAQSLPAKVTGHLERASALARESLHEARRSVRALRPQALAESSLSAALQALFVKMTSDTAVAAKLVVEGERRPLPQEWEDNLLRISQEVLTNVVRHARATEFHGKLSLDHKRMSLHLRDNGTGFDTGKKHEGFGLQGIRERVQTMGGQLAILSERGKGTSISIVLPMHSEQDSYEEIS